MHDGFVIIEFSFNFFFATTLICIVGFGLLRGRIILGWRSRVRYREHPAMFVGIFVVYASAAYLCVQKVVEYTRR